LLSRWWFWTIAGVVVVGAGTAVVVYAVNTEKSPPSGAGFSPTGVATPSLRF
jgi:hypothetical protein